MAVLPTADGSIHASAMSAVRYQGRSTQTRRFSSKRARHMTLIPQKISPMALFITDAQRSSPLAKCTEQSRGESRAVPCDLQMQTNTLEGLWRNAGLPRACGYIT